jgi:hypothetical protein
MGSVANEPVEAVVSPPRILVSLTFGALLGLFLAELVGVLGPRECPMGSFTCSSTGLTFPAVVAFAMGAPLGTWASWRWTVRRSTWGELSLLAALASPCLFLLIVFLDDAVDRFDALVLVLRFATIVGAPVAAVLALIAGRRARRGGARPITATIGLVFGWIEISMLTLVWLLLWALQDALNESI